jgi:AcrR family transcriptional regulator
MGTRDRVLALREQGRSLNQIAAELGVTKSTVCYHLRRLGEPPDERFNRRYDWAAVQSYYDEGHSITQCQERFGFSRETWHAARLRGDVTSRPHAMPIDELLAGVRNRSHVKLRLIAAGLKANRCEICGVEEWLGAPLSMALHHVNGDGSDNRLENLQMLCPNCHSQTENFAGRAKRRRTVAEVAAGATAAVDAEQECAGGPLM